MIRACILACLVAAPALADGPPPDPDWPCVQRRQPHLSLAQVWAGPVPDDAITTAAAGPEVQAVARVIALRRTTMETVTAEVDRFAADRPAEALTALYLATFNDINRTRDQVIAGITRYAHKQEALQTEIEARRQALAGLEAAQPQDFDAIDKAEADLDWATRIFQDRQQSLTYVCETPVILESRAFAIGRLIGERQGH